MPTKAPMRKQDSTASVMTAAKKKSLAKQESMKTEEESSDSEQSDDEASTYVQERRNSAWWAKRPAYSDGTGGQEGVRLHFSHRFMHVVNSYKNWCEDGGSTKLVCLTQFLFQDKFISILRVPGFVHVCYPRAQNMELLA